MDPSTEAPNIGYLLQQKITESDDSSIRSIKYQYANGIHKAYPECQEPKIVALTNAQSVNDVLNITRSIPDDAFDVLYIVQSTRMIWMFERANSKFYFHENLDYLLNLDEFIRIIQAIEVNLDSMDLNDLSNVYYYLNYLKIPVDSPVICKIILKFFKYANSLDEYVFRNISQTNIHIQSNNDMAFGIFLPKIDELFEHLDSIKDISRLMNFLRYHSKILSNAQIINYSKKIINLLDKQQYDKEFCLTYLPIFLDVFSVRNKIANNIYLKMLRQKITKELFYHIEDLNSYSLQLLAGSLISKNGKNNHKEVLQKIYKLLLVKYKNYEEDNIKKRIFALNIICNQNENFLSSSDIFDLILKLKNNQINFPLLIKFMNLLLKSNNSQNAHFNLLKNEIFPTMNLSADRKLTLIQIYAQNRKKHLKNCLYDVENYEDLAIFSISKQMYYEMTNQIMYKEKYQILSKKFLKELSTFSAYKCYQFAQGFPDKRKFNYRKTFVANKVASHIINLLRNSETTFDLKCGFDTLTIIMPYLDQNTFKSVLEFLNEMLIKPYIYKQIDTLGLLRLMEHYGFYLPPIESFTQALISNVFQQRSDKRISIILSTLSVLTAQDVDLQNFNNEFLQMCNDICLNNFSSLKTNYILHLSLLLVHHQCINSQLLFMIFNKNFINDKIDNNMNPMNSFSKVLLAELNRAVCLRYPEYGIPWFHKNYYIMKNSQLKYKSNYQYNQHILENIFNNIKNFSKSQYKTTNNFITPYGHVIDILVQDSDQRKIAFYENSHLGSKQLYISRIYQTNLELEGFIPILIPNKRNSEINKPITILENF